MTFEEWKKTAKMLKNAYTYTSFLPDGETVKTWYLLLKDLGGKGVEATCMAWILNNSKPPAVHDIRSRYAEYSGDAPGDWSESWERVTQAINKCGLWGVEQAEASFDAATKKAVKRMGGFASICKNEDPESVLRAQYRDVYKSVESREREMAELPTDMRHVLSGRNFRFLTDDEERRLTDAR